MHMDNIGNNTQNEEKQKKPQNSKNMNNIDLTKKAGWTQVPAMDKQL